MFLLAGPSRGTAMAIRVSSSVSGSSQCRSGTAVGYLAISIDDLDACRRRGDNHRSGRHRPSRHNGSGGRPTRDTCVTHGSERATNDGMRLRHPGILAGRRKQVAAEQAPDAGDSGQPDTHELVCHVGHCLPPTMTPWGTSSVCASSLNSIFRTPSACFKVNASAESCSSVFHSLMRSVYWGPPVRALLVMTYLRGTGRGPTSIQI